MRIGPYSGVLDCGFREAFADRIKDVPALLRSPDAQLIAGGRNMIVRVRLPGRAQTADIVIKAFARQTLLKDAVDRRRGSKACRTWRAASHLRRHGIGTPAPIGFLECRRGVRIMESYYISEHQETISSFKLELIRLFRTDPECWKFMELMECVACTIARMHAAGLIHNDLGNQNILLRRVGDGKWSDVQFVDLNRARIRDWLSPRARARDLSRISLPSDLLRVFIDMYYGDAVPDAEFRSWERLFRKLYAVHAATRRLRHPLRALKRGRSGEASDRWPLPRDMWIWDEKSAQAISTMRARDRKHYYSPAWIAKPAVSTAVAALPVLRTYRCLLRNCYQSSVPMAGRVGVAVDPRPGSWENERRLLDGLGGVPVFVRFYHHENGDARNFREHAVRELAAQGRPVAIGLVQDRRAVLEPARWRDFCAGVLAGTADSVEWVEAGHAVNRVKWGIWNFDEHRRLLQGVADAAQDMGGVRLMGPAVIDFEYPFLVAALKNVPHNIRFGALSHHLYVDRRGAPESRQGRFSSLHKFALARAVARWSPVCDDRLIVSEVNWPLKGTGIYSPVGSPYEASGPRLNDPSVDEEHYAAYMVRYLAIAICSGLVDRVYWWRLVARGFGLVDDSIPAQWRERPAYRALAVFLQMLGESRFTATVTDYEPRNAPGIHFLQFDRPTGDRLWLAWSSVSETEVNLPFECAEVTDLYGEQVQTRTSTVRLNGNPVYLVSEHPTWVGAASPSTAFESGIPLQ